MICAIKTPASYSRGQQIYNGDKPMSAVNTCIKHNLSGNRKAYADCDDIQPLRALENDGTTVINVRVTGKLCALAN